MSLMRPRRPPVPLRTGCGGELWLGPCDLEGPVGLSAGPEELLWWESYKAGSSGFDSKTTGLQTSRMLLKTLIKSLQF